MRINEILSLTWDRVSMKEGHIDLGYGDTKKNDKRRVFIPDDVMTVFQATNRVRTLSHRFIFTHADGSPVKSVRTAFENACQCSVSSTS